MTRDDLIEKMARAIHAESGLMHMDEGREFEPVKWEDLDDDDYQCIRGGYRDQASSVFAAIEDAGFAIVPPEATEEMASAAWPLQVEVCTNGVTVIAQVYTPSCKRLYAAMVAASPFAKG